MGKSTMWARAMLVSGAVVLGSILGCVYGETPAEVEQPSELAVDDTEQLTDAITGSWQFVYTDERRADVERRLAESIEDPAELERAKADAVAESQASVIEFTADRRYISRIGDEVLMSAKFDARSDGDGALIMTPVGNDGPQIRVELRDPDTLVMHDPRKGPLTFSRK